MSLDVSPAPDTASPVRTERSAETAPAEPKRAQPQSGVGKDAPEPSPAATANAASEETARPVRTAEAPAAGRDAAPAPPSPSPAQAPAPNPPKEVQVAPRPARPTSKPNPPSKEPFLPGQRAPKAPRTEDTERTRLWLSAGESNGVTHDAVIRCIQGETGLPAEVVLRVDIRDRHTFVDVASEHAAAILSKLKRAPLGGTRLKAKVA